MLCITQPQSRLRLPAYYLPEKLSSTSLCLTELVNTLTPQAAVAKALNAISCTMTLVPAPIDLLLQRRLRRRDGRLSLDSKVTRLQEHLRQEHPLEPVISSGRLVHVNENSAAASVISNLPLLTLRNTRHEEIMKCLLMRLHPFSLQTGWPG
jgi:hypothetical protein